MDSTFWMDRALALAGRGRGLTAPNPAVGAVLVKDGRLVGEGWHRGPGRPHAEAEALDDARRRGLDPRGATLYVTLEPCCHTGAGTRTPPCAQRLIAEGVSRVFAALPDPNPLVAGRGRTLLLDAGVGFEWGPRQQEARDLVADFAAWIGQRRPYFTLKWAQTLDGQKTGQPLGTRWITGEASRTEAHRLRSFHDTVAIGAGTLRLDDPSLTVRRVPASSAGQPRRLVFAGRRPLPPASRLFNDEDRDKTWIVADPSVPVWDQAVGLVAGRCIPWSGGDPADLWERLLDAGFHRILVEGGPTLLDSFVRWGTWDRAAVFVAPCLGGARSSEPGVHPPVNLVEPQWRHFQPDALLEGWNPKAPALMAQQAREALCSQV